MPTPRDQGGMRRLPRAERREQILAAATNAFVASGGFAATSLDDIGAAAKVSRMILYRHFDSKADMYEAAIDRAVLRLHEATTSDTGELGADSVPGMMRWAAAEPAAFQLLFRHAQREPQFQGHVAQTQASMAEALKPYLTDSGASNAWATWTATMATTVVIEGILTWLDVGQPDPDHAIERILRTVDGVLGTEAANSSDR